MIRRVIVLKGNSIGWFKIIFSSSGKRYLYQINNNEDYYYDTIFLTIINICYVCLHLHLKMNFVVIKLILKKNIQIKNDYEIRGKKSKETK